MQNIIGSEAEQEMLETFLAKACAPAPVKAAPKGPLTEGLSNKGRDKLQRDLMLLKNTNGLPKGISKNARVLVVEANEDKIIHKDTTLELLKDLGNILQYSPSHWAIPDVGHSLMLTELIDQVQNWLEP